MIKLKQFGAGGERSGFTLVEVMVSLSIGVLLLGSILAVFINYLSNSDRLGDWQVASDESTIALEKMIKGYGDSFGIRAFVSDDTSCITDGAGWVIADSLSGDSYTYDASEKTIADGDGVLIAENVSNSEIDRDGNLISVLVEIEGGDTVRCSYQTTVLLRN
jgi:prepilin-type N-terminal cleavage/methylation domain-containing protein